MRGLNVTSNQLCTEDLGLLFVVAKRIAPHGNSPRARHTLQPAIQLGLGEDSYWQFRTTPNPQKSTPSDAILIYRKPSVLSATGRLKLELEMIFSDGNVELTFFKSGETFVLLVACNPCIA